MLYYKPDDILNDIQILFDKCKWEDFGNFLKLSMKNNNDEPNVESSLDQLDYKELTGIKIIQSVYNLNIISLQMNKHQSLKPTSSI